jgi:hypothetical protein
LDAVDKAIQTSGHLINSGRFAEAHETLEVIRDLMLEARRRNNISYPLDSLSDFHTTMEEIVKPAMKMTPENITDKEIVRLRASCQVADEKWRIAETSEFDLGMSASIDLKPGVFANSSKKSGKQSVTCGRH